MEGILATKLYISAKIRDISEIFKFPEIIGLQLIGNSYIKFAVLDKKFRFTCGKSGLH